MITKNMIDNFFKERNHSKIIGREASMNSAVMVLFCEINGKLYVLFEKRAKDIRQGGEVSFPGGRRDKDDLSFLETAVRETFEEIGLKKERIENVKKYGTLIIPTGVIVEAYVGYVRNFSLEELNVNEDEVERIILVPLDYFFENDPEIEYVTVENEPFYVNEKGEKIEFPAKNGGFLKNIQKLGQESPEECCFIFTEEMLSGELQGKLFTVYPENLEVIKNKKIFLM